MRNRDALLPMVSRNTACKRSRTNVASVFSFPGANCVRQERVCTPGTESNKKWKVTFVRERTMSGQDFYTSF